MNQLTKEEVARVYAMYLHADAKCVGGHFIPNSNSSRNGQLVMSPSILADCWENKFQFGHFKLLLTPLSKITDEHLRHIAIMYGGKWAKLDSDGFLQIIDSQGMVERYFITRSELPSILVDQLREWGYMLPYKGVDLFKAGIAIDKTINQ